MKIQQRQISLQELEKISKGLYKDKDKDETEVFQLNPDEENTLIIWTLKK